MRCKGGMGLELGDENVRGGLGIEGADLEVGGLGGDVGEGVGGGVEAEPGVEDGVGGLEASEGVFKEGDVGGFEKRRARTVIPVPVGMARHQLSSVGHTAREEETDIIDSRPIMLFDGVCNGGVKIVRDNDRRRLHHQIFFASSSTIYNSL
ncbi:uncharacterized protein LOC121765692 [Salvia splendens]|uniref:uncharacterized protein LOC121765692 n=1 Tax=Salvia splendens TaxID=180675 RepID=UPI001C274E41|nr:uncharacterized protein LOC121765692 [Salvia splendens]